MALALCGALALVSGAAPAQAQHEGAIPVAADLATYADLASLAERSDMVIHVEIRRQTEVERERAPGLAPGHARLYIEARTLSLIAGNAPLGESLAYLVDVPLRPNGKPEKLKKREMILFADAVPGRAGAVQLTGRSAQLDYSPGFVDRLRPVLSELVAPDAPPAITGVSDALSVPGTLAGESETQVFLSADDGAPVSITVLRRPGQRPVWGVSWGEIIDSAARPPRPGTLAWYRLACGLPERLPSSANLAQDIAARRQAERDYALVVEELGACERAITEAI
ncbi:hypothetical protein [Qipengyuania nanhaisediminis]|uniref:hypothetical protein n=1 Tax=Qipengyuania nanhaisediminis TaxID=604088 RepID=UPI0038B375CC